MSMYPGNNTGDSKKCSEFGLETFRMLKMPLMSLDSEMQALANSMQGKDSCLEKSSLCTRYCNFS